MHPSRNPLAVSGAGFESQEEAGALGGAARDSLGLDGHFLVLVNRLLSLKSGSLGVPNYPLGLGGESLGVISDS